MHFSIELTSLLHSVKFKYGKTIDSYDDDFAIAIFPSSDLKIKIILCILFDVKHYYVLPRGIEPLFTAPEAVVLSIERRKQEAF